MSDCMRSPYRTRGLRFGIAGALILILCGTAYYLGLSRKERPPDLLVDSASLNFGEVWETSHFKWTLRLRNIGADPVMIDHFTTSCGCGSLEPPSLVIPARGTSEVTLLLNLNHGADQSTPFGVRDFSVMVKPVIANDPGGSPTWNIHGRVRRSLVVSPQHLHLNEVNAEEESVFTVEATPAAAFAALTAECSHPLRSVTVTPPTSEYGAYIIRVVNPPGELPLGPFTSILRLQPRISEETQLPSITVPVHGIVVSDLDVMPSRLDLGVLPLLQAHTSTVTVRSRSGRPFEVQGFSADSDTVSVARAPGELSAQVFRVAVTPLADSHKHRILFLCQRPKRPAESISLVVSYYGAETATPTNGLSAK